MSAAGDASPLARDLADDDLPTYWREADRASLAGQRMTLRLNAIRLGGALLSALGGVLTWSTGWFDVWAGLALVGFVIALVAEIVLLVEQPERDWYAGRALAESAKTLAWRYSVGADPFPPILPDADARRIMLERLTSVASKGKDRVTVALIEPHITAGMASLRRAPFEVRCRAYVDGRTRRQHDWYVAKAATNRARARAFRIGLVTLEVIALVFAAARALGRLHLDVSGLLAAAVATGAAWMALKQYEPLAAAYTTTARELSVQASRLLDTPEADWASVVADAEDAISREHTMWLASRDEGLT